MKVDTYRGYDLHLPTSGGKAGKGRAKTSTVQVRRNSCIVKQVRFMIGNNSHPRAAAFEKACRWIDQQP